MTDIEITIGPDGNRFTLDGQDISHAVADEPITVDPRSRTISVALAPMRQLTLSDGTLELRVHPGYVAVLEAAGFTLPADHDLRVRHVQHPTVRALNEVADDLAAEWGDGEMVRTGDVLLALRERALREGGRR